LDEADGTRESRQLRVALIEAIKRRAEHAGTPEGVDAEEAVGAALDQLAAVEDGPFESVRRLHAARMATLGQIARTNRVRTKQHWLRETTMSAVSRSHELRQAREGWPSRQTDDAEIADALAESEHEDGSREGEIGVSRSSV
jgi:hypothetical protein